jgi:nicotinamidase-related amidase
MDVQRLTVDKSGGIARLARERGVLGEFKEYFQLVEKMIPNINLILERCRELGIQVLFTRLASHTGDGSDMSVQNRARGMILTLDSEDSRFIEELSPAPGDIVIDKGCDNPFNCTEIELILRDLGIRYLILCGVRTPGYMNTAAFDAADKGFGVIFVSDACAGGVRENKVYLTGGLIRVRPASSVLELLSPLSKGGELG